MKRPNAYLSDRPKEKRVPEDKLSLFLCLMGHLKFIDI